MRSACGIIVGATLLAAAAPSMAAPAIADALAHCTAIDAPTTRLACYDAAAGRPAERNPLVEPPVPATSATAVKPTPARSSDPHDFGLTPAQRKEAPSGPESIHARILGLGGDGGGHAVVSLDNGQTWFVADTDPRLDVGQDITIKRAALGSFLMTTADRHAYRVRRTK